MREIALSRKKHNRHRNKSDLHSESGARPKKKNKKRYIENQKEKFRKSKEWKQFRSDMAVLFQHRDYITGKRLVKGFNVHHLKTELTESDYCDISNKDDYIPLNSGCHKMLHYLFTYYKKDKSILKRLVEVLDKMCELQMNSPVDDAIDCEDEGIYGVSEVDAEEIYISSESQLNGDLGEMEESCQSSESELCVGSPDVHADASAREFV